MSHKLNLDSFNEKIAKIAVELDEDIRKRFSISKDSDYTSDICRRLHQAIIERDSLKPDTVIAKCEVEAGYGTSYYDEKNNECYHECYASIIKVLLNENYWTKYDSSMSETLNHDFSLGHNFDRFILTVTANGATKAERVKRERH